MKKEELQALGLTDDQMAGVFKINGLDIEGLKADLKAKESEVEAAKTQLKTANKQIEDFKGLDVEAIKKQADEYKQKFEETEAKSREEIENLKFEYELESALKDNKARNVKASKALLDIETLKASKNRKEDLLKLIEAQKKEHDYLFEPDAAAKDKDDDTTQAQTQKPAMFTKPNTGGKTGEPALDLGSALAKHYEKK